MFRWPPHITVLGPEKIMLCQICISWVVYEAKSTIVNLVISSPTVQMYEVPFEKVEILLGETKQVGEPMYIPIEVRDSLY